MLNEVPNSVGERDGNGEAHRDVGAEVPDFFSVLAAVTEEKDGQDDIDDDVCERAVLLFGGNSRSVLSVGHEEVR